MLQWQDNSTYAYVTSEGEEDRDFVFVGSSPGTYARFFIAINVCVLLAPRFAWSNWIVTDHDFDDNWASVWNHSDGAQLWRKVTEIRYYHCFSCVNAPKISLTEYQHIESQSDSRADVHEYHNSPGPNDNTCFPYMTSRMPTLSKHLLNIYITQLSIGTTTKTQRHQE